MAKKQKTAKEEKAVTPKTKVCEVISTVQGQISVIFDTYGFAVAVDKPSNYNVGQRVRVCYSGTIGKPGFKAWIE